MNSRNLILILLVTLAACSEGDRFSTTSAEALRHYNEGVRYLDQFYYNEAMASFDSSLASDSAFAMAWGRLASLNYDLHNEAESRKLIDEAMRLVPSATRREGLYIRLWDHLIKFEDESAGATADSLIQYYPDEPEPYVLRGRLYEKSSLLDSAIFFYKLAAGLDTGYTRAIMHLGYAYSTAGDHERAIGFMQRYIRLAPGLADPRASYADLLLRVGRYSEALEQYRASLEIKPDYWYSFSQIGYIYSILGRLRDAEEQMLKGLASLPNNAMMNATRLTIAANMDMNRGEYSKAENRYRIALGIDSTSYEAAYGLVLALAKQGRFEAAEEASRLIEAELDRRNLIGTQVMVGFHLMKARILTEQKLFEEARTECRQALDQAAPLARTSVFRLLAEISAKTGEYDRGFLECEESLSINNNSPSTLLTLVRLYKAKGDRGMMESIGARLQDLWKDADSDFRDLRELNELLRTPVPS
jgi:tetratricopeptide (TPR) repeat protein